MTMSYKKILENRIHDSFIPEIKDGNVKTI